MKKGLLVGLVLGILWLQPRNVFAAGFALYGGSSRGVALGGMTGAADDPAALFYNPAGITQLEGIQAMGGATGIIPFADLTTLNIYDGTIVGSKYEDNIFTPPHLYYTHQLNQKLWAGFGIYSRFGLGSEFDPNWVGRYNSIDANIETLTYGLNMAYKVNDRLSLAVGVSAMWIDVSFKQAIDGGQFLLEPPNNSSTNELDALQTIEGDNIDYGFNLSAFYQLNDKWSFGFAYNSEVEQEIDDAVALFQKPSGPVPPTWFVDTNVAAEPIDLPQMIFAGFAYKHSGRLNVPGGVIRTGWSSIERLTFHYESPFIVVPGLGLALDEATRELDWSDVWRYNLGLEHKLNDRFNILWSVILDQSPIPDRTISYLLPANDRQLLNIGIRCKYEKWILDGSFSYLTIRDRDIAQRQASEGVLQSEVKEGGAYLLGVFPQPQVLTPTRLTVKGRDLVLLLTQRARR